MALQDGDVTWKARARGMWRGPTPSVLDTLTFVERAVIQLARLHISVKRVALVQPSFSELVVGDAVVRADLNSPQCFAE